MFELLWYESCKTLFEEQAASPLPYQCADTSNIVLKCGHHYCHIIHFLPLSCFEELEDYVEYLGSESSVDNMVSKKINYYYYWYYFSINKRYIIIIIVIILMYLIYIQFEFTLSNEDKLW